MAYRELKDLDLVKITGKDVQFNGRNAVVIDAGQVVSRVQITKHLMVSKPTICVNIRNANLKVRHEPYGYIVDGRIDKAKKEAFEQRQGQYTISPTCDDDEEVDEFSEFDHDDLVDMLVKLRNDVSTLSDTIVEKDHEIQRLQMALEGF